MASIILKTKNAENNQFTKAVGIDMGIRRFLTAVDTDSNVFQIDSSVLYDYCRQIDAGTSTVTSMTVWLAKKVCLLVDLWQKNKIEAVYVGCANGDFATLCSNTEHPFFKHEVFPIFLGILTEKCKSAGIYIETTSFGEAYTSQASGITSDYIPDYVAENPKFSGVRSFETYHIDENLMIDADVNAAINILHKAGFSVNLDYSSAVFKFIHLAETEEVQL